MLCIKQLKDLAEISGIHDSDYGGRFIKTNQNIMEIKEEVEYSWNMDAERPLFNKKMEV